MKYVNVKIRFGGGKRNLRKSSPATVDAISISIRTPFRLFLSEKTETAGMACFLFVRNLRNHAVGGALR